jgi:enterochelin esterase family protein
VLAQAALERKVVKLDPNIYDAYAGRYQLSAFAKLTLRRFRQRLTAQVSGQPPFEVFPQSETKFFWKVVDAQFTIEKDKEGKVTGLLFEQGGLKLKAKRISGVPSETETKDPEEKLQSPRLVAVAKELKGGDKTAAKRFWEDMQDKAPLIEPIKGDSAHLWVTFLWRGTDKTRRVFLEGGPPSREDRRLLSRLPGSDVWFSTERIRSDARFCYSFRVNAPVKLPAVSLFDTTMDDFPPLPDPLNPRDFQIRSLVELPAAPPQPWLERLPGVSQGKLTTHKIKSEILKHDREFTIYSPPGYDPKGAACGLLVLFDGPTYQSNDLIPGPVILDNLIAKKKIPPLLTVLLRNPDRLKDLSCSEPLADFLAKELVPWMRKNHHVSPKPERTIVGGLSLGGLMASYCAFRHPEIFGKVLSQSGSYQWYPGAFGSTPPADAEPGWLTRQFVAAPRSAVHFYLEAGRFEDNFPDSLLAENRRFRDVLQAKGYSVDYSEFSGGHDYLNWRGSFADGLIALIGTAR